jgi:hypothetical protein
MVGFSVEEPKTNGKYKLVYFTFNETFNKDDFTKFLGILTSLLNIADRTGVPFGFFVDAHASFVAPINAAKNLLAWKQKETPRIKANKKLICSSIYVKSKIVTNLITAALKISPTVSPNLITTDIEKAKNFVISKLEDATTTPTPSQSITNQSV